MKHEAILALYSSAVSISEKKDGTVTAYDANNNVVVWDASAVATKQTELENAAKLDALRSERNKRLADTDHYGLSDQTMSDAMSTYRQALRDITDTYSSLDDVVWPEKP
jgi:phosphoribosylformylglycinamidine (FGAM) synthase-like enzyme